jgi:hypothetical protein
MFMLIVENSNILYLMKNIFHWKENKVPLNRNTVFLGCERYETEEHVIPNILMFF